MNNNNNIADADRTTHLKVIAVSLAASIVVIAVAIAAHTVQSSDVSARLQARGPVIKAGAAMMTTTNDATVIR
jgi:hypothetical protein